MAADKDCCIILRGDVFIGPPMKTDGTGYDDGFGWGAQWGVSWGGFLTGTQSDGMPSAPPSRFLGNANLSWTPNYRDVPAPVRYTLGAYDNCATKIMESIGITLTAYCHNAENARMEFGGGDDVTISALNVVNENLHVMPQSVLQKDFLIPFAKAPIDSNQPVTLRRKSVATGVETPLIYGTDFEYSMFGVRLKKTLSLGNETLIASYTSMPSTVQDGYNDCGPIECSLTIEAANVANNNCDTSQFYKGRMGFFWPRVKLTPTGTRTLFSEEFTAITLEGTAEPINLNGKEVRVRKYAI
jgi:hypothetical protein